MAAATGLLGVSSTRRAAVLAVVICALALSVAVPLRNYVTQQQELSAVQAEQQRLADEVGDLTKQKQQLSDPAEVQAQARARLGYVLPGETPYIVQLPGDVVPAAAPDAGTVRTWYDQLWHEINGATG